MTRQAREAGVALVSGALFAVGLGLSGMTDPARVTAFLDWFGAWDPSLAFVMAGAIAVHLPFVQWTNRKNRTATAGECGVVSEGAKAKSWQQFRLLGGAALFGVGWGFSGYCPGPAVVSVGGAVSGAAPFAVGMVLAMLVKAAWSRRRRSTTDVLAEG